MSDWLYSTRASTYDRRKRRYKLRHSPGYRLLRSPDGKLVVHATMDGRGNVRAMMKEEDR